MRQSPRTKRGRKQTEEAAEEGAVAAAVVAEVEVVDEEAEGDVAGVAVDSEMDPSIRIDLQELYEPRTE